MLFWKDLDYRPKRTSGCVWKIVGDVIEERHGVLAMERRLQQVWESDLHTERSPHD